MVPRIIESPAAQLFPVRIREAIPVPKCFANIFGVILFAGFGLFGLVQNLPINDRTICDYPANPWVKGCEDRCRAPEASADNEGLIRRKAEAPPERNFVEFLGQIADDVEDVLMGRLLQKVPVAFP